MALNSQNSTAFAAAVAARFIDLGNGYRDDPLALDAAEEKMGVRLLNVAIEKMHGPSAASARLTATVVFPVPPFPDATAIFMLP